MKKVVIEMTYDADIILVPDEIEQNIKKIQEQFDDWIHDKANDHPFWVYKHREKYCPCFRGDAFVYYLNTYIIQDKSKEACVLEMEVTDYDKELTSIWF